MASSFISLYSTEQNYTLALMKRYGLFYCPNIFRRSHTVYQSSQLTSKLSFVLDTFTMENSTGANPSVGSSRYWNGAAAEGEVYALRLYSLYYVT